MKFLTVAVRHFRGYISILQIKDMLDSVIYADLELNHMQSPWGFLDG